MNSLLHSFKSLLIVFLVSIISSSNVYGQFNLGKDNATEEPKQPVSWTAKSEVRNGNEYTIIFVGVPDKGHTFYSQNNEFAMPMYIEFDKKGDFTLIGSMSESPEPKKKYDEDLKGDTYYWDKKATFKQKLKLNQAEPFVMTGFIDFQVCNDNSCFPVTYEFTVDLAKAKIIKATTSDVDEENEEGKKEEDDEEEPKETIISDSSLTQDTNNAPAVAVEKSADKETTEEIKAEKGENSEQEEKDGLWMIFFISFGLGMLALITPCVFPMIPMTVSFFMKGNKSKAAGRKQAIFFGLSIISIFTLLGLILTLTLGDQAMYIISTHWVPNTLFFVIFMIFALSFFGLFEITLPSSLVNKSDAQADRGGYIGTFFIAFTTVLVSFSCTGPILGAALIGLTTGSGNSMVFLMSMLGFAIGFALPFALLAYFPSVMGKMKSGAWLNTVKIVFGFLEIALGLKFLSMADLSANWGILDRETFLSLWIVTFTLLGFYLLGKLRFKGDAVVEKISVSRLFLAIVTLSFVVYMVPGLWGAPLKALSGYVPPLTTQDFDLPRDIVNNAGSGGTAHSSELPKRKYTDELHMPTGFEGFFDLEEAKAYAKKVNKPIFVDFTGKTCANCREMEYSVWTVPSVKKLLNEDFVMLALYADANFIDLPEEEWIKQEGKRTIKTLGKKNLKYQIDRFKVSAQPYYVIMDAEENVLTKDNAAHDKDYTIFENFLKEGLDNFKAGKHY